MYFIHALVIYIDTMYRYVDGLTILYSSCMLAAYSHSCSIFFFFSPYSWDIRTVWDFLYVEHLNTVASFFFPSVSLTLKRESPMSKKMQCHKPSSHSQHLPPFPLLPVDLHVHTEHGVIHRC